MVWPLITARPADKLFKPQVIAAIEFADGFSSVQALLSYAGSIPEGELVEAGSHLYLVAPASATDHHLTTAGGVKLYVQPNGSGAYDLLAMGAATDGSADASAACLTLGQWIANQEGGGHLVLPPGDLLWNSPVTIQTPTDTNFQGLRWYGFKISGHGSNITQLIMPETNTTGCITVVQRARPQLVDMHDMGAYSLMPRGDTTSKPTATSGWGFRILSEWSPTNPTPLGWGTNPFHSPRLHRLSVSSGSSTPFGRWSAGIVVSNAFYPEIIGCTVHNNHWSSAQNDGEPTEYETADPDLGLSAGIATINCYMPRVMGCRMAGRFNRGLYILGETGPNGPEDARVLGNEIAGEPEIAFEWDNSNVVYDSPYALGEPGGAIIDNHFNGHRKNVVIRHVRHMNMTGNYTHLTPLPSILDRYVYPDETAIDLDHVTRSTFIGNVVGEKGHYTDDDNCSRAFVIGANCHSNVFGPNHINTIGIGYDIRCDDVMANTFSLDHFGLIDSTGTPEYPTRYHFERSGNRQIIHAPSQAWTPQVRFGVGSAGIAYATQYGRFQRKGDRVSIDLRIILTSKGTATGSLNIAGLSGANLVPAQPTALTVGGYSGLIGAAASSPLFVRLQGDGVISVQRPNGSGGLTSLTDAEVSDTLTLEISGEFQLPGVRNVSRLS